VTGTDLGHQRLIQILLTGGLLVVAMLLGLAGQALIAFFFGAGARSDALFLARDVSDLAAKGLLTAQAIGVLVPLVLSLGTRQGQPIADRALAAILATAAIAGVALAALVVVTADPLVTVLAPGFDAATEERAVTLLRIIAPMAPFVAVATLAAAALQARQRFGRAMLASVGGAAGMVAAMPLLVHWWGVEGAAAAMTFGAVAQAACAWAFLLAEGVPPAVAPWREREHVMDFLRRALPLFPYVAASQASGVVLRIAASTLATGLYAAFSLAYRLYRSVITLLLTPVQHVLLPALSISEVRARRAAADDELVATLRYAAFVLVPVTVGLAALSDEAVSVVFERGAFTARDTERTGTVLALFALAIVPSALYVLLEQAAFARRHTRLVVRTNVLLEIVQGALYVPLIVALGAPGIPVAVVIALTLAAGIYTRELGPAPLRAHVSFAGRLALCALAMLATVLLTVGLVGSAIDPSPGAPQLLVIVPATITGAAAYLLAAAALKLEEPRRLAILLVGVARRQVGDART
jgi:putative peptidoglycan lipid II flippase